jgi:hypothetical protein
MPQSSDRRLKRQAIEIVAQLPEDPAEALRLLKMAERLVETFLAEEEAPSVVRLVG